MAVYSPQISAMKGHRNELINWLASILPEGYLPPPPGMANNMLSEPGTWQGAGQRVLNALIPQPEDTLIAPAELRPNFRSPEQIQALRRMMAEEQRARGPLNTSLLVPEEIASIYPQKNYNAPDPIDQILRGSWYHGMSAASRGKIGKSAIDQDTQKSLSLILSGDHKALTDLIYDNKPFVDKLTNLIGYSNTNDFVMNLHKQGLNPKSVPDISKPLFDELIKNPKAITFIEDNLALNPLVQSLESGFPLSAHDAQSISNKLGEPAGVSLSLNPTVSGKFSADPNIFRVMPLYGGPPTERTVNLMTPQGRNVLNDAYDVVANKILQEYRPLRYSMETMPQEMGWQPKDVLFDALSSGGMGQGYNVGNFNRQLSNQLQNQGYRHILYNPQRWNEYEMLALDPKYALPLDYRDLKEYLTTDPRRLMGSGVGSTGQDLASITPQAQKGISNIQDLVAQNASRLGDIYAERSWWDRLSEPVKNALLQDNPQAEDIIRKLKGGD